MAPPRHGRRWSGLYAAQDVRTKLAGLAGLSPDEGELADGRIRRRGQADGVPVAELLRQAGVSELVGEGRFALPNDAPFEGDGKGTPYAMRTFGAIRGGGRRPRARAPAPQARLGRYSVGRIINPRTARAQMTGAIIWGWGMAAMEASHDEPTLGRWLSKNLAGVAIPVNTDIPSDLQIHFVDEFDAHASPRARKVSASRGRRASPPPWRPRLYATGQRVRELPITPAKLVNPADRRSHE